MSLCCLCLFVSCVCVHEFSTFISSGAPFTCIESGVGTPWSSPLSFVIHWSALKTNLWTFFCLAVIMICRRKRILLTYVVELKTHLLNLRSFSGREGNALPVLSALSAARSKRNKTSSPLEIMSPWRDGCFRFFLEWAGIYMLPFLYKTPRPDLANRWSLAWLWRLSGIFITIYPNKVND